MMVTPAKMPFAPRPFSTELLSSWLLRVAAANMVSLQELLQGFEDRFGRVLTNAPIDYAIPDPAVAALTQFCRIGPKMIRALDLRERAPYLKSALLLSFQNTSLLRCPRCSLRRVRYAFCPLCVSSQRVVHVRWDWSVACLIRCALHRVLLLDGCPACGEADPLTFSGLNSMPERVCRSCGGSLAGSRTDAEDAQRKRHVRAVEDAYRAMLLGIAPEPALVGKATDQAFRQFVEDMLRLLMRNLNPGSTWNTDAVRFPRRDVLQIITALIENAAPSADQRTRSRRYSRGLILWAALLGIIADTEGDDIEQSSQRWPASLRRRFVSALYYRKQKRWPSSPYGSPYISNRFKYNEVVSVYDLSAGKVGQYRKSLN